MRDPTCILHALSVSQLVRHPGASATRKEYTIRELAKSFPGTLCTIPPSCGASMKPTGAERRGRDTLIYRYQCHVQENKRKRTKFKSSSVPPQSKERLLHQTRLLHFNNSAAHSRTFSQPPKSVDLERVRVSQGVCTAGAAFARDDHISHPLGAAVAHHFPIAVEEFLRVDRMSEGQARGAEGVVVYVGSFG